MNFIKLLGRMLIVALVLSFSACSDNNANGPENGGTSDVTFNASNSHTIEVSGFGEEVYIDIFAPLKTSYTITVTEGKDWCWTSKKTQATSKSDIMVINPQPEKLFIQRNASGERMATVEVEFSTKEKITLTIIQKESGTGPDRPSSQNLWGELPLNQKLENSRTVTHYAKVADGRRVRNYTVSYDTVKCIPNWIAYPLHDFYLGNHGQNHYDRSEAWQYDPAFRKQDQANIIGRSFKNGYNRGHMLMSNHRWACKGNYEMNQQTFFPTNIVPQQTAFNSGYWLDMENLCSQKICPDTLFIVTGCKGVRGYTTDQDGKKIAAPEYMFKVLLRTRSGRTHKRIDEITDPSELMCIGYYAKNDKNSNSGNLSSYTMSVADIERETGYSFFPMLDPSIAAKVKAQHNPGEWGIN